MGPPPRSGSGQPAPAAGRSHDLLAHTADAGFAARAPTLAGVFEEAGVALAELAADTSRVQRVVAVRCGPIAAGDLGGLAFAWLNELLGIAEARRSALVGGAVARLAVDEAGWIMEGAVLLASWDRGEARASRQVKAVTFHRLSVAEGPHGWVLTAYVDL